MRMGSGVRLDDDLLCPVGRVGGDPVYNSILVPVDGSDTAERALREAIRLARSLSSRIRLIHVVNSTPWIAQGGSSELMEQLLTQMRSTGESIVHEAKAAVRSGGLQVDSRLIEAMGERAGEFIVAEATDWPAELIVCGTHGRRGLRRLLVGSDAEYVVRHSPVPVLLVRGA